MKLTKRPLSGRRARRAALKEKPLTAVAATDKKFGGYLRHGAYTLCVGAGISRGITPTWLDLTRDIVNDVFGTAYDEPAFASMVPSSGWSLDAWIQAAANELMVRGKTISDVDYLIESKLYANVRDKAKGMGLEKYLTGVLNSPKTEHKNRVIEVWDFLQNSFPESSLLGMVRFLIDAARTDRAPRSVLTFNTDTLLETAIDLALRTEHYRGPGPHGHPAYYYVAVSRPGPGTGSKIPIFHCHGAIAPSSEGNRTPSDGRNRLVFLESEYLSAASSLAMWSQTVFMYYAQAMTLAFVRMSMSDPNIRRWMSAVEQEKAKDRPLLQTDRQTNPQHLWISVPPADAGALRIMLASQLHLGVRPAWISE